MNGVSAAGCALAVLLVCLLAHQAECGVEFFVGGEDVGWTNTANVDYNKWASNYKVKVGDSLIFVNRDTIDHSFVLVDKLGYDTCGEQGTTHDSTTFGPGSIIRHCIQGMKLSMQIYNADGSVNSTADDTDAPNANSASAFPGFSWISQLLMVMATFALVLAAIPVFT